MVSADGQPGNPGADAVARGARVTFAKLDHDPELAPQFAAADPFPHLVIDGLFPDAELCAVLAEIKSADVAAEINGYGSFNKRRISDVFAMQPNTRRLIENLNSAPFIQYLEAVTGICGLIPDPYLEGGGVHQIGAGGFLKVHTDFNWHRRLSLHRRINLLVYLNEDWRDEWNGQLELWRPDMSACAVRIAPLFNRTVIFATTDFSFHGHPDALACPTGVTRNSIAMYYYSATRPAEEIRYRASEMTNYQQRPNESFGRGRIKHAIHQVQIRSRLLRRLLKPFHRSR